MISCLSTISSKRSEEQSDTHWTDFIGNENGTRLVFRWLSGDTGKGFPSRSLRVSKALAWDSDPTMTRRDLSVHVRKGTFPPVFGCIF